MNIAHSARIVEVSPRDGLQNERQVLPPAVRAGLIERLADAGLACIEAGSFVSQKAVPQMAQTADVLARIGQRSGLRLSVLVPNCRGLREALAAGAQQIAVFAAASEIFSKNNINCSIDESLDRYRAVVAEARAKGLAARGYVSCVLGCPFEGAVPLERVTAVAHALYEMGCDEISLGDTIGVGTPLRARQMLEAVARKIPLDKLAVHFHDTYGQALANIFACLEAGATIVDSSVAGLGGCPYAPGAAGNVATEDVVYMLDGMGVETGVDLGKLLEAGAFIRRQLGREPGGVARAFAARREAGLARMICGDK